MIEESNGQIVARLERIEHENGILKCSLALMALAVGTLFVMAQAPGHPRTLEAERLVIRYPNGKEGIVLETKDSLAIANFKFPGGKDGIVLETAGGILPSAGAYFNAPSGPGRASIMVDRNESGVHAISPKEELKLDLVAGNGARQGNDFAELSIMSGHQFLIPLYNVGAKSSGEVTQNLYASSVPGKPVDAAGPSLQLLNGPSGAALRLIDKERTVRAVLGNTNLEVVRTGSQEARPLSSLVLLDKEGKVLWSAP